MLISIDSSFESEMCCRTFDMNGENRRVIMSSTASAPIMSHVFAMTVFDEFMYWTDWNLGTVTRADNRNGENVEVIYQASKRPMDVHIWHRLRQSPNEVLDASGSMFRSLVSFSATLCFFAHISYLEGKSSAQLLGFLHGI